MYTADDEVLLLRRHSPFSFWQSVTGSLQAGEVPADAARRELFEETGLGAEGELYDLGVSRRFRIDPRWRDRYPEGVTENLEHEWRYRLTGKREIHISPDEHSEYCWMPVSDAVETVWSWTNTAALLNLKAKSS